MYTGRWTGIEFVYRWVDRNTVCIEVGGQKYSLYNGGWTVTQFVYRKVDRSTVCIEVGGQK